MFTLVVALAAAAAATTDVIFDTPSIAEINKPYAANLYDGDIVLDSALTAALRAKRGAPMIVEKRKWNKSRPIGYFFDPSTIDDTTKAFIQLAIKKITANSCIRFAENGTDTKLRFYRGGGCSSYIGRMANVPHQDISIGMGCEHVSTVSHEIAHALGFYHTHARKDRDAYLTIDFSAIQPGSTTFNQLKDEYNDNFGVPYEYGSMMHNAMMDYSINGKPAIYPKEAGYERTMGQHRVMTFNDYKLLNLYYNCSASCARKIRCQNGGFQSSNNCNTCVCPDFFTGTLCQNANSVVALKQSEPYQTNFTKPLDSTRYSFNDQFNFDTYDKDPAKIIVAPAGRKIKVTIDKLQTRRCDGICQLHGLELVDTAGGDLTSMGKIFCCEEEGGRSFISKSNVIGYKAYAAPGSGFTAQVTYSLV